MNRWSMVLVAAAIFQLATGLANSAQWYPWAFSFRATHYAVAWIAVGALLVHVAVKLPVIPRALTTDLDETGQVRQCRLVCRVWGAMSKAMAGTPLEVDAACRCPARRRIRSSRKTACGNYVWRGHD